MADYSHLLRDRIRSQITKLSEKVTGETLSQRDRTLALENLDKWQKKIEELNDQIGQKLCTDNAMSEVEWETRETLEFQIAELTLNLREQSQSQLDITAPLDVASSTRIPSLVTPKMKLPEIPLPSFSNSINETLNFFLDNFNAVIDKYNLSQYEKFVYLKKQLSGEPLTLISSLSGDDQTFPKAVSLLREAFADVLNQQYSVIKRLSELSKIDTTDPYVFIGEIRLIQDLFVSLGLNIDLILQYFIWSALSGSIQNQLINMGKDNRPNLKFINENIFRALDRVRELESIAQTPSKLPENLASNCFAVDVETVSPSPDSSPSKKFCSLCKGHEGHLTKDCPKYEEPGDKVNRLKTVGGCTKCGFLNHETVKCMFRFRKRCFKCAGDHMSFLCTSRANSNYSDQSPKKVKKTETPPVQTGVVWTCSVNSGQETILPTFVAKVHNQEVRILKDSGTQAHFILKELADDLQLEVVCKREMTINGFNSGQKYHCNVVKIPLIISDSIHYINAICVPRIKANIYINELTDMCHALTSRGYTLADPWLSRSNRIDGIQIILGMSNPEVLPENHLIFGSADKIVLSKTPAGMMLMGDAKHVRRNLHLVPDLRASKDTYEATLTGADVEECVGAKVNLSPIVIGKSDTSKKIRNGADDHILRRESGKFHKKATQTNANIRNGFLKETPGDLRKFCPWKRRKKLIHGKI